MAGRLRIRDGLLRVQGDGISDLDFANHLNQVLPNRKKEIRTQYISILGLTAQH